MQIFNTKYVGNQFCCDMHDVAQMGFGFNELFEFQKLGRFVSFKNTYDEQQIKVFYCNAQREDDGMSLICPFKNIVVWLTPALWKELTVLDCDGGWFECL